MRFLIYWRQCERVVGYEVPRLVRQKFDLVEVGADVV